MLLAQLVHGLAARVDLGEVAVAPRHVVVGVATIDAAEGRLDVLIHNARASWRPASTAPRRCGDLDTNAAGIVRVTEAALPLLRKSSNPNVVTISSSIGSFWAVTNPERPEHGMPLALYAASKAAATMLDAAVRQGAPADQVQRPRARHHRRRHDRGLRHRPPGRGERARRRAPAWATWAARGVVCVIAAQHAAAGPTHGRLVPESSGFLRRLA